MNTYRIEVTDTFGGEANYSWARRYTCRAKSELGAINWLARNYGAGWRKEYEGRYRMKGACIVAFIDESAE
jgi:hypothetical protein